MRIGTSQSILTRLILESVEAYIEGHAHGTGARIFKPLPQRARSMSISNTLLSDAQLTLACCGALAVQCSLKSHFPGRTP
jgi:hypothetical protein